MASRVDTEVNKKHVHDRHHLSPSGCHYAHLKQPDLQQQHLLKCTPEERVAQAGARHVFYEKSQGHDRFEAHINLVALARMSLYALQSEILVQYGNMMQSEPMAMNSEIASNLRRLLHEYCMLQS